MMLVNQFWLELSVILILWYFGIKEHENDSELAQYFQCKGAPNLTFTMPFLLSTCAGVAFLICRIEVTFKYMNNYSHYAVCYTPRAYLFHSDHLSPHSPDPSASGNHQSPLLI